MDQGDEASYQNPDFEDNQSVSSIHDGDSFVEVTDSLNVPINSDFDSTDFSSDDSYMSSSSHLGPFPDIFQDEFES